MKNGMVSAVAAVASLSVAAYPQRYLADVSTVEKKAAMMRTAGFRPALLKRGR